MQNQLQKQSIFLLLIISILTFGIYIPIWFLNRVEAFNNLHSRTKLSEFPLIIVLVLFISSMMLTISVIFSLNFSMFLMADGINMVINLVGGFIILIYSFSVRSILEDQYDTSVSAIFTLLFSVFYLQYKINKLIDRHNLYEENIFN